MGSLPRRVNMRSLVLLALTSAALSAPQQQGNKHFIGGIGGGFGGVPHGGIGGIHGGIGGVHPGAIGGVHGAFPGNVHGGIGAIHDSIDDALINQGISQNNGGLPHNAGGGLFPGGFGR